MIVCMKGSMPNTRVQSYTQMCQPMRNPFLRFLTSHACTLDHWELVIRPPHEWCGGVLKLLFFIGQLVYLIGVWLGEEQTPSIHMFERDWTTFSNPINLLLPQWLGFSKQSLMSKAFEPIIIDGFFYNQPLTCRSRLITKPGEHECHHSTKFEKVQQSQSWSYVVRGS